MKILFVCPYPTGVAPSQRFRFEQYFTFLQKHNYTYKVAPFLDTTTWQLLYKSGHYLQKIMGITKGFLKRIILLFTLYRYDYLFIHREATPLGLPWFEWVSTKLFKKKVIFDFDDAIWLPNTSKQNSLIARLKFHNKTAFICRWAYKISVGNQYLGQYAAKFNKHIILNPTTIDTVNLHNPSLYPEVSKEKVTIGWTGTHSTIKYLTPLLSILKNLECDYNFNFLIISNQPPGFSLSSLVYVPWQKNTEIADLHTIDIGLMPLQDDAWAKGKCGFKALQYMAMSKPALVSPVGVNTQIIQDGVNGYLCNTAADWQQKLVVLLNDASLRKKIGEEARKTVEQHYSVKANQNNFLDLFT
ncbi:MAG: glycosyltransferase [Thermonemataceae bacterium]